MRPGLSEDLIARVLGAAPKYTLAELEEKFPPRELPEDAMVTRFAPSPTGYMHLGGLYSSLIDYKLAQQSGGIFLLRIEDTDTKREVKEAVDLIISSLNKFGIKNNNDEKYGPYYQSQRKDIYHSVAAELLRRGRAYPCFLTQEEMDEIRENQKSAGFATGIYGEFARDRDISAEDIIKHLDNGETPTIRLYSTGDPTKRIIFKDTVRGSISVPENNEDIVLIKSTDRLPTYHFAHLCDDHFMRVTHVVRGEEYFGTVALHIQMFRMMEWQLPKYIHTATLDKIDEETGTQRKLSKRKDPENNVAFFLQDGWPTDALVEYLGNILAPGYEEAKLKGAVKTFWDYELRPKKIPMSGGLFDMKKLEWWAKEYIGAMSVPDLVKSVTDWANEYGDEKQKMQVADSDYLTAVLAIERDNPKRVRKDFITWKQTLEIEEFFWDELFVPNTEYAYNKDVLNAFLSNFNIADDKDTWWNKIVAIAEKFGVKNGDVAMNLRVALSGRTNTPDLYSIMQVMGETRVINRVKNAI
ncbi:MAG: glutamate--tRNA ligase [Alphaproteobacteria bacterium]|nr:glutamate--tRNA ligase [Alphaproteobacteria bacterium]MBR4806436.1 glutamate--tRNA ligase [Alphaproteobacteria bacterium]